MCILDAKKNCCSSTHIVVYTPLCIHPPRSAARGGERVVVRRTARSGTSVNFLVRGLIKVSRRSSSSSSSSSKIGFSENFIIEKDGIVQNGAEVDDGSPPTHAVRAREGTRVTLCRVFVRPATTRTTGIHLDDEIYELARETNIN